jgi:rifampicin phosphotransferase
MPAYELRLGSGRVGSAGVGTKAALVDRLAASGISVPKGVVIANGEPVPAWSDVQLRPPVIVRSAFSAEDGSTSARAGQFLSVLHIEEASFAGSVEQVRQSGDRLESETEFRRDVLVMEQVDAQHAGVAFSEPGWCDDIVNVTVGLADKLVSGEVEGKQFELSRFGPQRDEQHWYSRLRAQLALIRAELGDTAWDIEWADDGTTCWIVQCRPITVALRRNEVLTVANHKEILPALPSAFMTSVIAACQGELFGWYRQFDNRLPSHRPFIEVVAGRPFLNLSLLEDMLRTWGLPSALVAQSFGGESIHHEPVNARRMMSSVPVFARQGLAQLRAVTRPLTLRGDLSALVTNPGTTFTSLVDSAQRAYVMLVRGMIPLSSFLSGPVSILSRTGTLAAHAASHQTISTHMALADGETLLRDFPHRGVYESDLARPRFGDVPDQVRGLSGNVSKKPGRATSLKSVLTSPVWMVTKRALSVREEHRHECMRAFHSVRHGLVGCAEKSVETGQLRSPDDLWMLTVDEVRRLDSNWRPSAAFWQERERDRDALTRLDPPDLVRRFDDPQSWSHDAGSNDRWTGIPLTSGTVTGTAWVLSEPVSQPPSDLDQPLILVARSIDAAWAITFPHVIGVAVETGGDLSHGSIVLRELGKPAVTNARNVFRQVNTGDVIELDAQHGVVTRR